MGIELSLCGVWTVTVKGLDCHCVEIELCIVFALGICAWSGQELSNEI